MNCEWSHNDKCSVAICIVRRFEDTYWFTCQYCFEQLKDNQFIEFVTDDPDVMACYEVLKL